MMHQIVPQYMVVLYTVDSGAHFAIASKKTFERFMQALFRSFARLSEVAGESRGCAAVDQRDILLVRVWYNNIEVGHLCDGT